MLHAIRPIPRRRRPSAGVLATLLALAVLLAATLLAPGTAWADESDGGSDPGLNQTIGANEPIVHGAHVLSSGHVDMGPRFDGTAWKFLIHDDAARADAKAQTVWRYPQETVLQVADAAKLTVPEDDVYSFVGAEPGSTVWVVPQTQNSDVVWTGWNTQDPTVMQKIDRGATFSVDGVQGPGIMTVYLQSGDFGAPQVLWDSRKSGSQPIFVDTNTHTHANWVFTKPGVYLVRMTASATLTDGSTVSDTQLLRFAVGSATATDEALTASWKGAAPASSAAPTSSAPAAAVPLANPDDGSSQDPLVTILIVAIVVVALALVVGFSLAVVRGNRARKRALTSRTARPSDDGSGA